MPTRHTYRDVFAVLVIVNLILLPNAQGELTYEPQVGALGDNISTGNKGVSVEIRTHTYYAPPKDFQYFWVGDTLDNGVFIQFGYIYEPGYYCLKGQWVSAKFTCTSKSESIGGSDARWEWQYWPNGTGKNFFYEKGPANSAGLNGTWHRYSIQPNAAGVWSFLFDGQEVSHFSETWARSKSVAYFMAEKGSNATTLGQLGPVEFRNLAYLKDDGWHNVTRLYARVTCSVNTNCNINNPYGVMSEGSGHVIAGSGIHQPKDLEPIWPGGHTNPSPWLQVIESTLIVLILIAGIIIILLIRKRRLNSE